MARSDARTDAELLIATQYDPEAFGVFYDRHFRNLYNYFWSRTRDAEVAADLCAETFSCVLSQLADFDSQRGVPSQWMYGIAANLLKRFWRTLSTSSRARDRLQIEMPLIQAADLDRLSAAEAGLDSQRLHAALDRLPRRYGEAVTLRVIDQLPYAQISSRLNCSPNAARVRVLRGLRRLRNEFESGGTTRG